MRKKLQRLVHEFDYLRGHLTRALPDTPDAPKKIFVIGTGRSGTHWLGETLGSHPMVHVAIESNPEFGWVTRMALDPAERSRLLPRLVHRYDIYHRRFAPLHYADKSHPNLWLMEPLMAAFAHARFIAITREIEPTVASMLRHKGVRFWMENWQQYPIPNLLLGITADNREQYISWSLEQRSTWRVICHTREIARLQQLYPDRLLVLEYSRLLLDPFRCTLDLAAFLGVTADFHPPLANRSRDDDWRQRLNGAQIQELRAFAATHDAQDMLTGTN
ncbi:MAG: sulfotransferase [Gammaproteobacteria bacterium]|nr:sulfotransferase [Gammaproteobacteria bacterium]